MSSVEDERIKIYDVKQNEIVNISVDLNDVLDEDIIRRKTREFWQVTRVEEEKDDLKEFFSDIYLM